MPFSQKQRRAAFAELERREEGEGGQMFESMSTDELEDYAHKPLEKKKKKPSTKDAAAALRSRM